MKYILICCWVQTCCCQASGYYEHPQLFHYGTPPYKTFLEISGLQNFSLFRLFVRIMLPRFCTIPAKSKNNKKCTHLHACSSTDTVESTSLGTTLAKIKNSPICWLKFSERDIFGKSNRRVGDRTVGDKIMTYHSVCDVPYIGHFYGRKWIRYWRIHSYT